jgi:prepilin-type N-terminal cleavage/methylation domain-containing protein
MDARRAGFSLIELLTVVAIMGLVAVYMGRILTVNEKTYSSTDQLSQAQQNLRALDDLLERDLRHAGLMVPDAVAVCGVDNVNAPDILYVSDALAIDPQNDFSTYGGIGIESGDTASSTGSTVLTLDELFVEPSPPNRPAYDTDGNGTNDSDFQVGGGVIIASTTNPTAGVACGTITNVTLGSKDITVEVRSALSATTDLIAVPAHEYRVDGMRLLWNGNALTDAVEDLQVTYIIENDDPPDNQVDAADEVFGDDESAAHQLFNQPNPNAGSGAVTLTGSAAELVREVRVNIVVRTRLEDEDFTSGRFQGTENRDVSGVTADGFRRRVITTKVMLRNVAMQI